MWVRGRAEQKCSLTFFLCIWTDKEQVLFILTATPPPPHSCNVLHMVKPLVIKYGRTLDFASCGSLLRCSLWVIAKSSQVPNMFPKEFSIASHFYPICFGKCCPSFTYKAGQRGGTLHFKVKPFLVWGASIVSFCFE